MVKIRIQQLYLIIVIDKEILLNVRQHIILVVVTYVQFLDLDIGIQTFVESILAIELYSSHVSSLWVVVKMNMRIGIDQYENDRLLSVFIITYEMIEALDLPSHQDSVVHIIRIILDSSLTVVQFLSKVFEAIQLKLLVVTLFNVCLGANILLFQELDFIVVEILVCCGPTEFFGECDVYVVSDGAILVNMPIK